VEFRRASRTASMLTRPLMLYYSALNLVRALLLAYTGNIGGRAHGLSFREGASLLECRAEVMDKGTFPAFATSVGAPPNLPGATLSLRDLLAVIPEMMNDFPLLNAGTSSVVPVRVKAFIQGPMTLRFYVAGVGADDFRARWT